MADDTTNKSKADFAKNQLERHGWSEGKGLGKEEQGISKAIKVNVKTDLAGVGFDAGSQFSFQWWDHVFNKAAKSIVIQESEEGVEVVKSSRASCDISNKRPNKNSGKPLLYGRFVKATCQSQDIVPGNSDEDSDLEKDFSHLFSDNELFQACGGRTAHKAARHGLRLDGKLRRVEEQERLGITADKSSKKDKDRRKRKRKYGEQHGSRKEHRHVAEKNLCVADLREKRMKKKKKKVKS